MLTFAVHQPPFQVSGLENVL